MNKPTVESVFRAAFTDGAAKAEKARADQAAVDRLRIEIEVRQELLKEARQ
jgi:hypothetical protein